MRPCGSPATRSQPVTCLPLMLMLLFMLPLLLLLHPQAVHAFAPPPHFEYRLEVPDASNLLPLPSAPADALCALCLHHMPPSALTASLHALLAKFAPLTFPSLEHPSAPASFSRARRPIRVAGLLVPPQHVTSVGDVDGNGVPDLVVAHPAHRAGVGTARLYLMAAHGATHHLYSRDLAPSLPNHPSPARRATADPAEQQRQQNNDTQRSLPPNARFGAVVHPMPNVFHVPGALIAVGAPGANLAHFILLNRRADVVQRLVLPLSDVQRVATTSPSPSPSFSVRPFLGSNWYAPSARTRMTTRRRPPGERVANAGVDVDDKDELPEVDELAVESAGAVSDFRRAVRGAATMTLQAADGGIRAVIDLSDIEGDMLLHELDRIMSADDATTQQLQDQLRTLQRQGQQQPRLERRRRQQWAGPVTARTVKLDSSLEANPTSRDIDAVAVAANDMDSDAAGRVVACADGHLGEQYAVPYCVDSLPVANETHCRCTARRRTTTRAGCLQYKRTVTRVGVLCSVEPCPGAEYGDWIFACEPTGPAFCRRELFEREGFVSDGRGEIEGYGRETFCHRGMVVEELAVRVL